MDPQFWNRRNIGVGKRDKRDLGIGKLGNGKWEKSIGHFIDTMGFIYCCGFAWLFIICVFFFFFRNVVFVSCLCGTYWSSCGGKRRHG